MKNLHPHPVEKKEKTSEELLFIMLSHLPNTFRSIYTCYSKILLSACAGVSHKAGTALQKYEMIKNAGTYISTVCALVSYARITKHHFIYKTSFC